MTSTFDLHPAILRQQQLLDEAAASRIGRPDRMARHDRAFAVRPFLGRLLGRTRPTTTGTSPA